jgi:hypothetical protein
VVILVLSHLQEVTLEFNKVVTQDQDIQVRNSQALAILEADQDQVILVSNSRWAVIQDHNLSKWVDTLEASISIWEYIQVVLLLQVSVLKCNSGLMQ